MFQRKRTRPVWLFLLFYITCSFCLEDCKTFLIILELRFPVKQAKDILSGGARGQSWIVKSGSEEPKAGDRKTIGSPGSEHIGKWVRGRKSAFKWSHSWGLLYLLQGGCPSPTNLNSNQLTLDPSLQAGLTSLVLCFYYHFPLPTKQKTQKCGQNYIWRQFHWPHMLSTFNFYMPTFISIHKHLF